MDLKEKLLAEYPFRIELHCHTSPASGCAQGSPETVIDIYHREEVDAVCITNHWCGWSPALKEGWDDSAIDRYLDDYYRAEKHAKKYGMKVYLGCEYRLDDRPNDYLIYGVDRDILITCRDYMGRTIEEYRNEVKLPDSVFIQAHPFRDNMQRINPKLLDGFEGLNFHSGHNSRVALAEKFAKQNGLNIIVGGSDFHELNLNYEAALLMRVKKLPEDSFGLAKILKSGDYIFELGKNSIIIP